MIKIVNGNILNATEDIICQQVNCKGVMGAGLAKQIRNKYPEVYKKYKKYCTENEDILGDTQFVKCHDNKIIANIFGQEGYGRDKQYTNYGALTIAFRKLRYEIITKDSEYYNKSIAIPYGIGCSIAGGNWDVVYNIIDVMLQDYDVTIYKFE